MGRVLCWQEEMEITGWPQAARARGISRRFNKNPGRADVSSWKRQWCRRRGRLLLPQLSDDTLNRPQRGHVDRQTFLDLQLHEPVPNDGHDLVGVGDIHG